MSVLDEILDGVRADLAERQQSVSLDELKERAGRAPAPRDALAALRRRRRHGDRRGQAVQPVQGRAGRDRRPGGARRATTRRAAPTSSAC